MKKLAFYGTLRKGEGNYNRFDLDKAADFHGTTIVEGYTMMSLGGYPMIFPAAKTEKITVDLFTVNDERAAEGIKRMELGAGYKEEEIQVNGETYTLYVSRSGQPDKWMNPIPGGDWVKYNTERWNASKGKVH